MDNIKEKITHSHPYRDETGKSIYFKVRIDRDNGEKYFKYEHINENGERISGLAKNSARYLFLYPEVLQGISEGKPIFLVEGEKDAITLLNNGLIATTSDNTHFWSKDFTRILKDADVAVLYDYDNAGFKRKEKLCEYLAGRVKSLRVVELPGLVRKEKGGEDITDWLNKGNTIEQLLKLLEDTPDYVPEYIMEDIKENFRSIDLEAFLALELPEREILLYPFLPTQGLVLLYAKRGVGKTHVALGMACSVACGGRFLNWNCPRARKVLYVDGEMPAVSMQERLRKIYSSGDFQKPEPGFFQLITPDLRVSMPDLSTPEGQAEVEELAKDAALIVLDNLSTLFRSGSENEAESWQSAQDWLLKLRRTGKSVVLVHHAGKGGQQRGTSKKEDILDAVIILKQPDDYQAEHGACFEVHFEKARHFHGNDAASFQVKLTETAEGSSKWEISNISIDKEVLEIADFMNKGFTIKEIEDQTSYSKSQIETLRKKARNLGLTNK